MPADRIAPVAALFPPRDERLRCDDWLTRTLADADALVARGPVSPTLDREAFRADLRGFDFAVPRPLDEVLQWAIARLQDGVVHLNNPRYFGLFNPGPSFPAQCADRVTAVFNPQLATATTSPVAVELEAHVIREVGARAGLPGVSAGHFCTGGAEANFTALICALTRACAEFAQRGARAFRGEPTCYASRESHLAWLKIAHQAGIGRNAVRLVETDGTGRMDVAVLAALIAADRAAGFVPVMIAATAGTTNAGMIDPLVACADLAASAGVWFHVDAAWGGALICDPSLRRLLTGIERADSVTIDAHKWFATTMGCGMLLSPHGSLLSDAFQVSTTYMPSNEASIDPYVNSVQWSRRFLGLRLFLSLGAAGWEGFAAHVQRSILLTGLLRDALVGHGWQVANDSAMAVLCVTPPAGAATVGTIVRRVVASGRAWISVAAFERRAVIRACVTHGETSEADVFGLVAALVEAAVT